MWNWSPVAKIAEETRLKRKRIRALERRKKTKKRKQKKTKKKQPTTWTPLEPKFQSSEVAEEESGPKRKES
jgi:hypothetical protein